MAMEREYEATMISYDDLSELIQWIKNIHGFNFEGYSMASLKRRVSRVLTIRHLSLYDLKSLIINDHDFFEDFIAEVTVNVTEMFRDPSFYRTLHEKAMPYLASYPRIKVWSAGCSTGEEVYSLSILLKQEGLYDRSFIYGTDISQRVVEEAREGIYSLGRMKEYSANYIRSGGRGSLADYYIARYDAASIVSELKRNTFFSVHNLTTDGVFNEFQLVCCRNVLIYFGIDLQKRVLKLLYDSLCPLGFLCLGPRETLRGEEIGAHFRVIDKSENIYQKID